MLLSQRVALEAAQASDVSQTTKGSQTTIEGASRSKGYFRATSVAFWSVHAAAIAGVAYLGFSWRGVVLAIVVYFARMVLVTAGYHRYFAHRSFRTSRVVQFLLALGAQSAAQRGVLWWASHHRWHHKHSDGPQDVHSPRRRGFWYSHIGWVISPTWDDTNPAMIADLAKYPELRFLDRDLVHMLPTVALALAFLLVGGLHGLVWGYLVTTVLVWHGSFSVNSLSHLFGKRRYRTTDDSRNSMLLALLTTGEGWHNNHHYYQSSANQGFRWWEIDMTYWVLRLAEAVGLIWDLRRPPREVVASIG